MATFSIDDLRKIMRETAGPGDHPILEGDILDVPFTDLDFDSLAVLELATRIQQDYGTPFPDDAVEEMSTPGDVLAYVTERLAA